MKEHENSLNPEAIDTLTERSSGQLPQEERRLIQGLYTLSQEYARENERSLERIWNRFVQSQEHSALPQERQQEKPGGKLLFMEGKAMQEKDFHLGTEAATFRSQPARRSRRSFGRTLGISVAAAVVLLTILSWALLSSGLLHGSQAPGTHGSSTIVSSPQKGISYGTLLCSFSDDNNTLQMPIPPTLDWSSNGQIAATYNSLKTFNVQGCAPVSSQQSLATSATWSPDGKRLLVFNVSGGISMQAEIIDASTGNVIAGFPTAQHASIQPQNGGASPMGEFSGGPGSGGPIVGPSVWTADGTQVVSVVTRNTSDGKVTVQLWDASTGALVRTLLTLGTDVQPLSLSPNGKYLALQRTNNTNVEIWDVNSGARVSTIPFNQQYPSSLAWSPDGASVALGLLKASEVQIWSTATGQLTASFTDHDASNHFIGALAWSPDGKYIAESGSDIHIWDVKARKFVATFGRVDTTQWIATLAWAPDSRMLVSSTNGIIHKGKITENKVNVWKLA